MGTVLPWSPDGRVERRLLTGTQERVEHLAFSRDGAALAQTADDLAKALAEKDSDWAYLRFVPTKAQVAQARKAGKKVLVVGKAVLAREVENWDRARESGVDALLTDHPPDCRLAWRGKK